MAVSANCKKPVAGVRGSSAQEGSKRRNSWVSVVSGTITGTYPLRYPRPYVSSPSYSSREFVTRCVGLLSQISVLPGLAPTSAPLRVAEISH